MAFTQFTEDMDIISKLPDDPNADLGVTPDMLKAEFDKAGKRIKDFINNTLLQEALEQPTFVGLVKSDGNTVVQAEAGTDYQAPLKAGTDYQTPLKAGTDYQKPIGTGDIKTENLADGAVTKVKLSTDVTATALGGISMKKVWKNASPSSSFVGQTISAPGIASADAILIPSLFSTGNVRSLPPTYIPKGNTYGMILITGYPGGVAHAERIVTVDWTAETVSFDQALFNGSNNDGWCMPHEIIIIKGVAE